MDLKEKIRLFNGVGSWKTYTANGKIPEIVMSDGPHGLRKQESESYADLNKSNIATCFPTASCIASSWNKKSLTKLGQAIAAEALAENIHIMLGCGLNIKRSPLCGRNFEYFSEDPYLSGELAANYVKGMQEKGVASCIKHFACNNQEKRRQTSSSNVDLKTLHEIYLRGFEIAVKKSQPLAIMSSYNKINGLYASHNPYLLNKVLREKWGFNGIVISDWGACINAPECIKAGLDLAMPDSYGYFDMQIEKALKDKSLDEADLDTVNKRLISTAEKLHKMRETAEIKPVDYKAQHQLALELAEDSAVLLKNDGLLPLSLSENKEIVVIGELAEYMKFQAGGSSHITTKEYPNALSALQNQGFSVDYSKGYFSGFCKRSKAKKINAPLIEKAIETIKKPENKNKPVLFFCGLTEAFEGEGFDRDNLELPPEQIELLEKILEITQKVIVISFSGAPVNLLPAQKAAAILQMYLCGEACGQAIADLISGKVTPSGKLAESWPVKIEDTPSYNNFAQDHDNVQYEEGPLVGYRWYQAKNIPVQYPFGYGLSYTSFEYSDFSLPDNIAEELKAFVTVKNTGKYDGSEIVQLYVQKQNNENLNDNNQNQTYRELRGFEKVFLKAGEEKQIEIPLDDNAFKSYSLEKEDFVQIKGDYLIEIGASVEDIKLTTSVTVDGEEANNTMCSFANATSTNAKMCSFANAKLQAKAENANGTKSAETFATFSIADSLGDMAKSSWRIRLVVKILTGGLVLMNKGKSREDPAVKIAISAILENPLESLISTSGGLITYKLANKFLKWANADKK